MTLNEPRPYETTYIISPELGPDDFSAVIEKFNEILRNEGAQVTSQEVWGFRKLAYPIRKKNTGYFVYSEFTAPPTAVEVLEREFSYDERMMRYLTVKLDKHAVAYNDRRRAKRSAESQNKDA